MTELELGDLLEGQSASSFLLWFAITNPNVSTVIVGTASLKEQAAIDRLV